MNRRRFLLSLVVSIVILILIFVSFLDFQEFLSALASVSVVLFFLSDVPYLIQALMMGYRLSYVMKKNGRSVGWREAFFSHLFGMLGSDFSFGRIGYLSAALPLKSDFSTSVGAIFALSSIDVIVKASLAVASVITFFFVFRLTVDPFLIFGAVMVIVCGILFFLIMWQEKMPSFVRKIPYVGKKGVTYFARFREALLNVRESMPLLTVFPLIGWFLRGLEWYILANACGLPFTFFQCLLLHPLLTLVRFVPITVTGLGAFEFALITLFPSLPPSKLVTFGILDMVNNSFVDVFGLRVLFGSRGDIQFETGANMKEDALHEKNEGDGVTWSD